MANLEHARNQPAPREQTIRTARASSASNTSSPPRCDGSPLTICDQDAVWDCPSLSAADQEIRDTIEADCNASVDAVGCLLEAEFPMIDMVLSEDCAAADMECVGDIMSGTADCENP